MKNPLYMALFSTVLFSTSAFALEELTNKQLSETTGKDGVTIRVSNTDGTIGLQSMSLIDKDGFSYNDIDGNTQNITNAGGLSLQFGSTKKVRLCSTADTGSGCTASKNLATIEVDTDGGNSTPTTNESFINARVSTDIKSIYIPSNTKLSLLGGNVTVNNAGQRKFARNIPLMVFEDGISIDMKNALEANIQLGSQPQGHMLLLGGNTLSVNLGDIKLYSYDIASPTPLTAATSQVSTNVNIKNIKFDSAYADIDAGDGIVFGIGGNNALTIEKVDIQNTVFGKINAKDTAVFNNLENASIGNISMQNIKINNLKVGIKGL